MRYPSFRRDLGLQLLALYLLFVGPVIIAALVFDWLAGARLERDVKAADLALARSIAAETDAAFQNALGIVGQIAGAAGSAPAQPDSLAAQFAAVHASRPEIGLIYLLDTHGVVQYHYPEGPVVVVGVDFSFRPFFPEAVSSEGPQLAAEPIALSPATGQPVTTASAPVRDEAGKVIGLIAADLDLRQLSATLSKISSDRTSGLRVSIFDSSGQIIADSAAGRLYASARTEFPAVVEAAARGQAGGQIEPDSTGRQWLRSYAPIPATAWTVVVHRPADMAFASPRAFHNGLLIAIGVFVIGGLFFWMMLSRRVIGPLERLATFSAAISQRAVAPEQRARLRQLSDRSDQMGSLIRALTQMEQDIERRFAELSTLLETSTAVVSTLDSQRVLDTILEQVQRLLGVDMAAIVVLDERAGELRLRAARGLSEAYVHYLSSRITLQEPHLPSVQAIHTGLVVQVSDTDTDPGIPFWLRERSRAEGYRALTAVPLVAPHSLPAALIVYWREPHQCPAEEISLIVNFANQAAMAIENAALFALTDEKLREQTRTLEALVQSLNDGLILESSDQRILYCNRRICELTEIPPDEIPAYTAEALREKLLARSPAQAARSPHLEVSIEHKGRTLDLRLHSFDVTDEQGQLIGRGQLWLDVTGDKELDRMKSALIATASHELRSPLATIKGYLSSLLADDVTWDPDAQQEFIRVAHAEADRLSALVTDLLDLSSIESGTLTVNREQCNLPDIIARAATRTEVGSRLRLYVPGDLPYLVADRPRIEAVLRNLIENALKYSSAGSPISVTAERANGSLLVRVANDGAAIPPDQHERIFDRFYRLDNGLNRQTGGAGLGLAICKGYVEAHGGKIWVEPSESGTVLAFTLPVEQDRTPSYEMSP
jgi:signal transduction histidine kinase